MFCFVLLSIILSRFDFALFIPGSKNTDLDFRLQKVRECKIFSFHTTIKVSHEKVHLFYCIIIFLFYTDVKS